MKIYFDKKNYTKGSSSSSSLSANVDSRLTVCHETRPGALVEDKYAMTLKYGDVTVGHIPKFLSKIMYFYIKNGGELLVKITKFSRDLPQGGMEFPALYIFKSTNSEVHSKLPDLIAKALKEYNDSKKDVKNMKNKKKK